MKNFDDYQQWTRTTAIYPDQHNLTYTTLGLASEAGEVAGKVKKILRDGDSDELRDAAVAELGDVLWYLARVSDELGVDLSWLAVTNRVKLESRLERDKLQGSGDNR